MNVNQGIECDVCKTKINLRFQVGLNKSEFIKFLCPECGIPIECSIIILLNNTTVNCITKDGKLFDSSIKNAKFIDCFAEADYSIQCSGIYFTYKDIQNPHKSLLLSNTFEHNLLSPFMQCNIYMGSENLMKFQTHVKKIYYALDNVNQFEKINALYYSNNKYYLNEINNIRIKQNLEKISDDDISKVYSLYFFSISYLKLFIKEGEFNSINTNIINDINIIKKNNLVEFINLLNYFFVDNDFINKYQQKINKTINNYIEKFKYFIPAIGLEYLSSKYKNGNNISNDILDNYTIRTATFNDIKSLYLETYENVIEVYDILVALNNINHRNNFDKFNNFSNMKNSIPNKIKKNPNLQVSSFKEFGKLNKGLKLYYIDEGELFDKYMPILESKFRNSIGHESWSYDLKTQMINYTDNQNNVFNYSFLEYSYQCYSIFVKLISIYKILIDLNNQYLQLKNKSS